MKHIFYLYNMVNIEDKDIEKFISALEKEFEDWGYKVNDEIQIMFVKGEKKKDASFITESAIVISPDYICNHFSKYGKGEDFWPYIREKIDLILVSCESSKNIYWPSVQTPILHYEYLNFTTMISILLNYNK